MLKSHIRVDQIKGLIVEFTKIHTGGFEGGDIWMLGEPRFTLSNHCRGDIDTYQGMKMLGERLQDAANSTADIQNFSRCLMQTG